MTTTLAGIIAQAARHGDRTALIVGDHRWSFAALDRMANGVAHGLAALGVAPGDRVLSYELEWFPS